MEQIEVVILPDGTLKAEAEGFKGKTCLEALNKILDKNVMDSAEKEAKPEFYETITATPSIEVETDE